MFATQILDSGPSFELQTRSGGLNIASVVTITSEFPIRAWSLKEETLLVLVFIVIFIKIKIIFR